MAHPVYVRDVAEVRLGYKKPDGFVRRFGRENLAINAARETGANVLEVMRGLREMNERLNAGILRDRGLVLTQVYDETEYIYSAIGLVNENIILGGALTVIVLMLFLHLGVRTFLVIPVLAVTAAAALLIHPWFFALTLITVGLAGFWFARGALVVSLAIPVSIIGTFLLMQQMGRSLNVVSLAGLAFAVGMLVDNAIVVLENIYRHHEMGSRCFRLRAAGDEGSLGRRGRLHTHDAGRVPARAVHRRGGGAALSRHRAGHQRIGRPLHDRFGRRDPRGRVATAAARGSALARARWGWSTAHRASRRWAWLVRSVRQLPAGGSAATLWPSTSGSCDGTLRRLAVVTGADRSRRGPHVSVVAQSRILADGQSQSGRLYHRAAPRLQRRETGRDGGNRRGPPCDRTGTTMRASWSRTAAIFRSSPTSSTSPGGGRCSSVCAARIPDVSMS